MASKVINVLSGVDVAEISLVRRGANNRRVAMTKGIEMKINETITSVLETELEGEKELKAAIAKSGASEEGKGAALATFRLMAGFKEEMSPELFAEVAKAAKYTVEKAAGDDDAAAKAAADTAAKEKEAMSKAHDEQLTELRKSNDEKDAKIEKQDARIEKIEKTAEKKELVQKCKDDHPYVPGMTAEQQADTLLALGDNKETKEGLTKSWVQASAIAEENPLMKTLGQTGTDDGSSAKAKIEKLAQDLRKSDSKLSPAQARRAVRKENRKLAAQESAEG